MASVNFDGTAGTHLASPWASLDTTFIMDYLVLSGSGGLVRESGASWQQGARWTSSNADDSTVIVGTSAATAVIKIGPAVRANGTASNFYHVHTQDFAGGSWVYLNLCRGDTPMGNGLITLTPSLAYSNVTHTLRLTAETQADRVRLRVWWDGVLQQFPTTLYYHDDVDAGRLVNTDGNPGLYMAIQGETLDYSIQNWSDSSVVTIRAYEQGQGTVLASQDVARGAPFSLFVSGLALGQHTLEATAQDFGADKAESARVSAGTITMTGYSDTFAPGNADTLLATYSSNWADASSWHGTDSENLRVARFELDGSGNVRATDWWVRSGARYTPSTALISQAVLRPITDAAADGDFQKGVIVCAGGSPAYWGYLMAPHRTAAQTNWVVISLGKDGNASDPLGYWIADSVAINADYTVDHTIRLVATVAAGSVRLSMYLDGSHVNVNSAAVNTGAGFQYDSGTGDVIDPSTNTPAPFTSGNPGIYCLNRGLDPAASLTTSFGSWQDY